MCHYSGERNAQLQPGDYFPLRPEVEYAVAPYTGEWWIVELYLPILEERDLAGQADEDMMMDGIEFGGRSVASPGA